MPKRKGAKVRKGARKSRGWPRSTRPRTSRKHGRKR